MPISKEESGDYVGYTLGDSKPTLYFQKGHYTQVHSDPRNIGWHPNGPGTHYGYNVAAKIAKDYLEYKIDEPEIAAGLKAGTIGVDDSSTAQYCEWVEHESKIKRFHISRSKQMKVGATGFSADYNATYAAAVMLAGVKAPNEP